MTRSQPSMPLALCSPTVLLWQNIWGTWSDQRNLLSALGMTASHARVLNTAA